MTIRVLKYAGKEANPSLKAWQSYAYERRWVMVDAGNYIEIRCL